MREGSAVFVSDFHSMEYGLNKVMNFYMNEYDHVYILGDVTDRGVNNDGTGGLSLLIRIMRLTKDYRNQVTYIPGNHDELLYRYMTDLLDGVEDYTLTSCITGNHGSQTMIDVKSLLSRNRSLFNELYSWLGSLPIQSRHYYNGVEYNAAHALFNEELYEKKPKFNLADFVEASDEKDINNVLWFRKGKDGYNKSTLPKNSRSIMVIGHTPLTSRGTNDMTLVNGDDKKIKVICVDGGMTFGYKGGKMLKYVTGTANEEVTPIYGHKYVGPAKKRGIRSLINNIRDYINEEEYVPVETEIQPIMPAATHDYKYYEEKWNPKQEEQTPKKEQEELKVPNPLYGDPKYIENQLTNHIIDYLRQESNTIEKLVTELYEYYTKTQYAEIANAIKVVLEKQYGASGYKELHRYILDTAIKYIEMCITKKSGKEGVICLDVDYQIMGACEEGCLNYITRYGNARTVATNIGLNTRVFIDILKNEGLTLEEYFKSIKMVNNSNQVLSRIMAKIDIENQ